MCVNCFDGVKQEIHERLFQLMIITSQQIRVCLKLALKGNQSAFHPVLRQAQMQGQCYWGERVFEDGKSECGLADYQALGWRAWHHHVTLVLLAMLLIAERRAAHHQETDLLMSHDIAEILSEILPRKAEGRDALMHRIN